MKKGKFKKQPPKKQIKNTKLTIDQAGTLLDILINTLSNKSRKLLKAVLRDGQVMVNDKAITQFDHPVKAGSTLEVCWEKKEERKHPRDLKIVFEDEHLIVINKPAGLLTVATEKEKRKTAYSMLSNYVKSEHPDNKIFIVHRLDRETSGLLLFARNEKVKQAIQSTWDTTISERAYVGVVEGSLKKEKGVISSWLTESKAFRVYSSQKKGQGLYSVTNYKTLQKSHYFTLVQLVLETGRKHQIRVHMQDIKHPIVGDRKYGSKISPIRRMALHAMSIAFTHPVTGEKYHFETAIPKKFIDLFTS